MHMGVSVHTVFFFCLLELLSPVFLSLSLSLSLSILCSLCAPYGGSNSDHCTSRLGNSLPVFTSEDISNEGFGEYFNSVHLPTTKCREIVLSIMCHSFFPYCDPSSTVPRPRPICKESCDAFYSEHCSDSITPIVTPKIYSFINSSCNHSYGDTHKEAGDAPECFVVPLIGHADIGKCMHTCVVAAVGIHKWCVADIGGV